MTRDEIISEIKSIDRSDRDALDAFVEKHRNRTAVQCDTRSSWANDLEQAVIYILADMNPLAAYANKAVRQSIRPNRRSVVLAFILGFLLIIEVSFLLVIASRFPNEAYGYAGILFIMLFELSVFMWWMNRIRSRNWVNDLGMHASCVKCRYDLSGLDSPFGEEVWVGPERCPECGHPYPAVV